MVQNTVLQSGICTTSGKQEVFVWYTETEAKHWFSFLRRTSLSSMALKLWYQSILNLGRTNAEEYLSFLSNVSHHISLITKRIWVNVPSKVCMWGIDHFFFCVGHTFLKPLRFLSLYLYYFSAHKLADYIHLRSRKIGSAHAELVFSEGTLLISAPTYGHIVRWNDVGKTI